MNRQPNQSDPIPIGGAKKILVPSLPIPIRKTSSTLRCVRLPSEIQPFLDSVDIVSSTPPVHTSGLMGPSVTIGPLATSFHWMDDSESESCLVCQTKFAWNNRQHHCRVCGSLVCGRCSKERDCPVKLMHDQPTSASVLWGRAQSAMSFMGWAKKVKPEKKSIPSNSGYEMVRTRVCSDCFAKIEKQDILRLYTLMEKVFVDRSQYAQVLDLRNWGQVATRGPDWTRLVSIFRQAMAQSQHFVTNPWIEGYRNRNATDLQKKVQSLLLWVNQPLFTGHYFYSHAWLIQKPNFDIHWPHLVGQPSPITKCATLEPGDSKCALDCEILRCKVRCDADPTLEIRMHMLFSKARIQTQHTPTLSLSLPLALTLMPTMLIRGIRDSFYISCLRQSLERYGPEFGAPLYFWLHSIVCTGAYLDQIGNLFSTRDLSRFIRSFKWGNIICQALRHCNGDLKYKEVRRLATNPKVLLPGSHNLIVETIFVKDIKRTESNSSPYLLPCLLRNTETNKVSKQVLLIKHNQSLFNDWVSMALIKFCVHITKETHVQSYHMAPVGHNSGILVTVPNSLTVYEAAQSNSIFNLIYAAQPAPKPPVDELRVLFSSTLAFFTILSCFLGWRDRIASNMMVHPGTGTLFHIDFEYMAALAPRWKATLRKCSGSQGGGFERSGDTVTMTPLIPQPVIEMIGGRESDFYKNTFKTHCNKFYSEFYKLRHVFYYATECLCSTPSQIGRLNSTQHEQFFRTLELTFLRGIIINPTTAHGVEGDPSSGSDPVSINPLVIEPDQQTGWNLEGVFATMHSVVQKFRAFK
jgi:hypothetical protein